MYSAKKNVYNIKFQLLIKVQLIMKKLHLIIIISLSALLISGCTTEEKQENKTQKLQPPSQGVYHSAFPDFGGPEDNVTPQRITNFENMTNKAIVWAPFSENWGKSKISFPENSVKILHAQGITPYIRMMPRNMIEGSYESKKADPVYNLQRIINGDFDENLRKWARDAKNSGIPIMIDFAPKMNGDWFSWSGKYNGGSITNRYGDLNIADGPERYRDAYRHIINTFREEGATNVTWVFHVNANSFPDEPWNNYNAYYPGDEYIDWIGMSVYGAITPAEDWEGFTQIMDTTYPKLEAVSKTKPLAVMEYGVIERNGKKAEWIRDALESIKSGKYPRIKAICYWHESWINDDGSTSNLKLNSSIESLETYKKLINDPYFVENANFGP